MSIRALIIDDEPLARKSVRRFLKNHPDVLVVDECGDGRSAVTSILLNKPDLVFLDVQIPELDGFGVVSTVGVDQMPATIFVTAYDRYALEAFDANALDYLLKPFGKARFDKALSRVRDRIARTPSLDMMQRLVQTIETASKGQLDHLPVAENGRIIFVKTREIRWIESAGNYARVYVANRHHDIRETLTNLERKLNPREFVRIHRSTIVNLHYIKEVQPWFNGYHLVLLENGKELRMSRYQLEVAERLGLREPEL